MRRSVAIKKMHYIQFTIVKWTFDPYTCVIFQCSEWFYILFSHFLIPHIYKEHYRSKKTTTKNFAQKVLPPMCETTVLWCAAYWLQYFFGVLHLRCIASLVFCICTFGMLCIGIFGGASLVRFLLCNASLVHCFLVLGAIYFWCCVFGAMHCQLYRAGLLPQWRIYFL